MLMEWISIDLYLIFSNQRRGTFSQVKRRYQFFPSRLSAQCWIACKLYFCARAVYAKYWFPYTDACETVIGWPAQRPVSKAVFVNRQASLETFFGIGLIVGPMVGGALYQVSLHGPTPVTIYPFLFTNHCFTYSHLHHWRIGTPRCSEDKPSPNLSYFFFKILFPLAFVNPCHNLLLKRGKNC